MAEIRDRHPRNCQGPFYVENGQCISCGAPESETGGLMSHDAEGHCFFVHQPLTEEETNSAIRGVWASCCGAVRYGGNDPQVLIRLAELGKSSQCDDQPPNTKIQAARHCARFVYTPPGEPLPRYKQARQIVHHVADWVGKSPGRECFAFRNWWNSASFKVRWGKIVNGTGYTVQFKLSHESDNGWLLRMTGHEVAHTAFAIQLDKALQQNLAFRSIRWFDEIDWPTGGDGGRQHPY